jgi:hypothetical protein
VIKTQAKRRLARNTVVRSLASSCKCGVAQPPDLTPAVAAATVNDGLDIPAFLRRY